MVKCFIRHSWHKFGIYNQKFILYLLSFVFNYHCLEYYLLKHEEASCFPHFFKISFRAEINVSYLLSVAGYLVPDWNPMAFI